MSSIAPSRQSTGVITAVAVVFSIFCGLVASQGVGLFSLLIVGIVVALVLLALPTAQMVWAIFFFTFFIQGTIQYYGKNGMATWVAFGLAAVVLTKMAGLSFNRLEKPRCRSEGARSITILIVAYLGSFLLSYLINFPALGQTISAFKNAIPALGLLLAIGWGGWEPKRITGLWWLVVIAGVVQLPFVVHQHFFIATSRATQGWDSVVGTMGGSQEGGGLSAMLVILAIVALAFVLARYKQGLIAVTPVILMTVGMLIVMILGEVKAVFFWLLLALTFLYWRPMTKNPVRAIGATFGVVMLLTLVFSVYQVLYWEKQNLSQKPLVERIGTIGGYFFDVDKVNYRTGEVSRAASIDLWIKDPKSTPVTRVFGYGPGASKSVSVLGQGEVAHRYAPLGIDSTAVATLLWDVGLFGLVTFSLFLFFPIRIAKRFLNDRDVTPHARAEIETAVITLAIMISLLIYNRTLIDQIVTQALAYLAVGTIVYHSRRSAGRTNSPAVCTR